MKVVALSGGVGGARLVDGLAQALPSADLTVVVNTGDDFHHLGLFVTPDLDTVMYTLAGLAPVERGWGLSEESFYCLERMARYGAPDWFRLGDRDLATHILRTHWLSQSTRLTEVTGRLCKGLGVDVRLLPMCDAPRPTFIDTVEHGTMPFQEWLVQRRASPMVKRVRSVGTTQPTPEVLSAINSADLVVITPSNPYVSIDPILGLDGLAEALRKQSVVAVSPIVGGKAVKGPLAAMIPALRSEVASASAVAAHYGDLVDTWVVEVGDDMPRRHLSTSTIMTTREDRVRLAREVLAL
jgi:LPPG:FO 2-phospho-L-lactate transferase